jgi:hypothetical protein
MENKHMKKYSPSLVIREMQIKITLRFHINLIRMASIKKTNKKMLTRMWREKEPLHAVDRNVSLFIHWKSVWRFLKKLKTEALYDRAIPLLVTYLKE